MKKIYVDIGGFEIASGPDTQIIAQSVGGGVAVCFFSAQHNTGALLNTLFPTSRLHPDAARINPEAFCDTGIIAALRAMQSKKVAKDQLRVKVAGGAEFSSVGPMDLGSRNILMIEKIFQKIGIGILGRSIGGKYARDVNLDLNSGRVRVDIQNGKVEEL